MGFFFGVGKKLFGPFGTQNLLANLTGDVRLQAPREYLVNDAVTVVWIVGLLAVVVSCRQHRERKQKYLKKHNGDHSCFHFFFFLLFFFFFCGKSKRNQRRRTLRDPN